MADSGRKLVRLEVDREAKVDPAVARRRVITARYSPSAGQKIKKLGLWDKEVRATFDVTRAKRGPPRRCGPVRRY